MRIMFFILLFFIVGCVATPKYNFKVYPVEEFYILKLCNNGKEALPEYGGLQDRITKQEYRILPLYLKDCYEKEAL